MAKAKTTLNLTAYKKKPKKRRKGIHAKTKMTSNKGAHLYVKPNTGQGV